MLKRPIEGAIAMKFWSSANICNRVKAICAYSDDAEDANRNLARYGYPNDFRKRVLRVPGIVFNNPSMTGIAYNTGSIPFWKCVPFTEPPTVASPVWIDNEVWKDNTNWAV